MGDPKGFLKNLREDPQRRLIANRLKDWREIYRPLSDDQLKRQGARCMDCGVPFCQGWTGCPVQNMIPDWNDFVYRHQWKQALIALHSTNNFPEFTGRLCPAPCESACVLGIIDKPVSIRSIEWTIVEKGFSNGWIRPILPKQETGKRIAIIGSGPAGLAAAQQLRRGGHAVTVFEKDDRIGGLLRYGIPDFKMEKWVLDRRLNQMADEGVCFKTNQAVGKDISIEDLKGTFDAICLAIGAGTPRDLPVPGRDLKGIHFAMEFLTQQNRCLAGDKIDVADQITTKNKRVIIIGGGDTAADCLGTSLRQGSNEDHQLSRRNINQVDILSAPPLPRNGTTPIPHWSKNLYRSPAYEEGGHRDMNVLTKGFSARGNSGQVGKLHAVQVKACEENTPQKETRFVEIKGSEFEVETDLVLIAMGFIGSKKQGVLSDLGVRINEAGQVAVDENHMTNIEGVFAAGDTTLGSSLIAWAIREGRAAAMGIETYLSKN